MVRPGHPHSHSHRVDQKTAPALIILYFDFFVCIDIELILMCHACLMRGHFFLFCNDLFCILTFSNPRIVLFFVLFILKNVITGQCFGELGCVFFGRNIMWLMVAPNCLKSVRTPQCPSLKCPGENDVTKPFDARFYVSYPLSIIFSQQHLLLFCMLCVPPLWGGRWIDPSQAQIIGL